VAKTLQVRAEGARTFFIGWNRPFSTPDYREVAGHMSCVTQEQLEDFGNPLDETGWRISFQGLEKARELGYSIAVNGIDIPEAGDLATQVRAAVAEARARWEERKAQKEREEREHAQEQQRVWKARSAAMAESRAFIKEHDLFRVPTGETPPTRPETGGVTIADAEGISAVWYPGQEVLWYCQPEQGDFRPHMVTRPWRRWGSQDEVRARKRVEELLETTPAYLIEHLVEGKMRNIKMQDIIRTTARALEIIASDQGMRAEALKNARERILRIILTPEEEVTPGKVRLEGGGWSYSGERRIAALLGVEQEAEEAWNARKAAAEGIKTARKLVKQQAKAEANARRADLDSFAVEEAFGADSGLMEWEVADGEDLEVSISKWVPKPKFNQLKEALEESGGSVVRSRRGGWHWYLPRLQPEAIHGLVLAALMMAGKVS
jgi:hypothetical protein